MQFCGKLGNKVSILHIDTCPLCGGQTFDKRFSCADYYATGEVFAVCACVNCGFMFTQDAPSEAFIGRYYESPDYVSHSDTHEGLMNKAYHAVRSLMLRRKARLVRRYSPFGRRLLDIGTGTGYFPALMAQEGWAVSAIEKNEQARKFAQTHFGLNVSAPETFWTLPEKSYDVITLWHVLEHLQHLDETWSMFHRLLDDRGVLIVAVPNPSSYDARHYKEMWGAYDVPRHLWHFTPEVLGRWAVKHGFEVKDKLPMPFDAFYVSMLSEKYRKASVPFVRGFYTGIKAWFSAIGKVGESSSVIYILCKQKQV